MIIYDDIPLPVGTEYYQKRILQWDADTGKYLILHYAGEARAFEKWLPRAVVERQHGSFLCEGLGLTTHYPASPNSTRFFRRKEKNLDDP